MPKKSVAAKKNTLLKKATRKSTAKVSEKKSKPKKAVKKIDLKKKPETGKKRRDFIYAVGRRKSSNARVRFYSKGNGEIIVNQKDYKDLFPYFEMQKIIIKPLIILNKLNEGKFTIKVSGGGKRGQAESIQLGISRALLASDENIRKILRANGLLTRDPRVKERKKYGLKKARRAPQWQKR